MFNQRTIASFNLLHTLKTDQKDMILRWESHNYSKNIRLDVLLVMASISHSQNLFDDIERTKITALFEQVYLTFRYLVIYFPFS